MNGVHDMGGMHGFGAIDPEHDEPVFHARWEARTLAMTLAMGAWRKWNIDASRHERELIAGPEYLRMSYYESWFERLITLMTKAGLVTRQEIDAGSPEAGAKKATPPLTAERVAASFSAGSPVSRDLAGAPRFRLGDSVRTKNINPPGHTRLPRYARGHRGTIMRDHGVHVFPDSNAHFLGENPQRLYSVRFAARELWGEEANPRDTVFLDLWDAYLERA